MGVYSIFKEEVREKVNRVMESKGKKADLNTVLKNNDVEMDVLTLSGKGCHASPIIYLNQYYKELSNGREMDDIVQEICGVYHTESRQVGNMYTLYQHYDQISKYLVFKLVNKKLNQKLLKEVPHRDFLDLCMVCYCMLPCEEVEGSLTIMVHNSHLRIWGINPEELFAKAQENTSQLLPPVLKSMDEIVMDMLSLEVPGDLPLEENEDMDQEVKRRMEEICQRKENGFNMYGLTNVPRTYGAACLLYKDLLKEFAKEKGTSLYILPSSIHEVILVPRTVALNVGELNAMVRAVNRSEVEEGEVLSNHAYFYSMEKDEISSL